ncbi:MAG: GNAT family N-acetyltransferase [Oscillospiraceae bacterium]|jgi:GNAT superfamily N-acetyltransferase|nr:GNAT family N-acetyltransferase [Oscillospiraceae bacterium]
MNIADITFKYGAGNADLAQVTALLQDSYWVPRISRDDAEKMWANSAAVVSVYDGETQIGCCRAISDTVRFAYVMDVFIAEAYRGRGIGQSMVKFLLAAPELATVYHWTLLTRDAHKFYEKIGFGLFSRPGDFYEIRTENPYAAQ